MDVIENGVPPTRLTSRPWVVLAAAAIVVVGGLYGLIQLGGSDAPPTTAPPTTAPPTTAPPTIAPPAASSTAGPATQPGPLRTVTPTATKVTATVPVDLQRRALESVSREPGTIGGAAFDVVGSSFLNGSSTQGFADETLSGPGRCVVRMLCLGRGTVLVIPADDPDVNPLTDDGVRITCTAEPGIPVSTEVTITGATLHLYVQPDADTVGALAYRALPRSSV